MQSLLLDQVISIQLQLNNLELTQREAFDEIKEDISQINFTVNNMMDHQMIETLKEENEQENDQVINVDLLVF